MVVSDAGEVSHKMAFIVFPPCGNIVSGVARALRLHGFEPYLFAYGVNPARSFAKRLVRRVLDPLYQEETCVAFNRVIRDSVLPSMELRRPDFILFLKGEILDEDVRRGLVDSGIPIVCWAYDSLARCPGQRSTVDIARHSYVMDGSDVDALEGRPEWLPLGYDPEIYRPVDRLERDIDVLFAGSLKNLYRTRRSYLRILGRSALARRRRCVLVGSTGTRVGDRLIRVPAAVDWVAKRLPEPKLAALFARAKICVNIHQDDGAMPVNPMFFAIPGAGACQVAETKPYLQRWLVPARHFACVDENDFEDVLAELLEDDVRRQTLSEAGFKEVSSQHTYFSRVAIILARLLEQCSASPMERHRCVV